MSIDPFHNSDVQPVGNRYVPVSGRSKIGIGQRRKPVRQYHAKSPINDSDIWNLKVGEQPQFEERQPEYKNFAARIDELESNVLSRLKNIESRIDSIGRQNGYSRNFESRHDGIHGANSTSLEIRGLHSYDDFADQLNDIADGLAAKSDNSTFVESVINALKNGDVRLRCAAARAVPVLASDKALEILEQALAKESNEYVVSVIKGAIFEVS